MNNDADEIERAREAGKQWVESWWPFREDKPKSGCGTCLAGVTFEDL